MAQSCYKLGADDEWVLAAARELLSKISRMPTIRPAELQAVARLLNILERMPDVSAPAEILVELSGPELRFDEREIHHWWHVEVLDQRIGVKSGGHLYQPSIGGDSFSCMQWSAHPEHGCQLKDFLEQLWMIDDAQPLDEEIAEMDLENPGYSLTVTEDGEQIDAADEDG